MKKKICSLLSHAAVKNSIWIIAEKVVQMIISFFITMISARYLGPSNYGVLNYGASFVTFFLAITKLGLDMIVVNELIKNPRDEGKIMGTSIVFRLISSGVSIFLIYLCILVLKPNDKLIMITTMLQSIALIFQAASFLEYWFQAKLQSKYVSIAKSIAYVIISLYKVYLLIKGFSVQWFAMSTALDYLIICLFLFAFYKKKQVQRLEFDLELGKSLLGKSYHFILSGLMVVVYTQIDKIMIGSMINEANVGYYSAALTLCSAFSFIPTAIITSAKPSVYAHQKNNRGLYLKRIKQVFSLVFWLCVGFAFFSTCFSKLIIILIYGKDYSRAIVPFIVLVWSIPFAQLGLARGIWIVGEGLNKYTKKYLLYGAILNVILNAILIPYLGMIGAAIATLITEIFTCIISPLFYKETREFSRLAIKGILFKFEKE